MASSGDGDQPRQPKDMPGLLKFCLDTTQAEDASNSRPVQEMDSERRQWLQDAITSMSKDPVKIMMEDLKTISADDENHTIEDKQTALENLQDYCEDMDLAIDFHKIGGYESIKQMLDHSSAGLRWRAAELLGTLNQNNPYCQKATLSINLLPRLLQIVDEDDSEIARTKALFAVSGLLKDYPEAQDEFCKLDGFSTVLRAMQSTTERLKTKAAFLIKVLCEMQPNFKKLLTDMGFVTQLSAILRSPHDHFHEHVMAAMLTIVQDNPAGIEECAKPELGLQVLLTERREMLAGKEEFLEELDYCSQLHQLVSSFTITSSNIDR